MSRRTRSGTTRPRQAQARCGSEGRSTQQRGQAAGSVRSLRQRHDRIQLGRGRPSSRYVSVSDVSRHAVDSGSAGGRCGYQGFPLQIAFFTTDARRKSGRRAGHVFTDRRENDDAESAYRLPRTSLANGIVTQPMKLFTRVDTFTAGSCEFAELYRSDTYSAEIGELLVGRVLRHLEREALPNRHSGDDESNGHT